MINITKNRFTSEKDLGKQFEDVVGGPPDEVIEKLKKYKDLADMLRVTINTPGWQAVILPFLESQGNAAGLFKLFKGGKADEIERAYAAGRTEAYYGLLNLARNVFNIAKAVKKFEEEKKKDEKKGE